MKIFGKSVDEWITFETVKYAGITTGLAWVALVMYITNSEYHWLY